MTQATHSDATGENCFESVGSIFLEESMNFATSVSVTLDLRYREIQEVIRIIGSEVLTSWNPLTSPCNTAIQRALS